MAIRPLQVAPADADDKGACPICWLWPLAPANNRADRITEQYRQDPVV